MEYINHQIKKVWFFLLGIIFISCASSNSIQIPIPPYSSMDNGLNPNDGSGESWYVLESENVPFKNEYMEVYTSLMATHIQIQIVNRTNEVMKVVWDECAYIDFDNKTHMVYHSSIKHSEREKTKVPSLIAPGGEFEDIVIPIDHAKFHASVGRVTGGWLFSPLYPPKEKMSEKYIQWLIKEYQWLIKEYPPDSYTSLEEKMAYIKERSDVAELEGMIGKKFGIILTIEVGESKKAYTIYNIVKSVKEVDNATYKSIYRVEQ